MIKSVDKAMSLLALFTEERPVLSVGELSQLSGIHKSTVSRIMATMGRHGLVTQNEASRKYEVGPEIRKLTAAYLVRAARRKGVEDVDAFRQKLDEILRAV